MELNDDIRNIKGIGEKTSVNYRRIGINTVGDLVMHIPRGYEEYKEIISVKNAPLDCNVIVEGVLSKRPSVKSIRNRKIVSAQLNDGSGTINLVWFNMPFLANSLRVGTYYILRGKITVKNDGKRMVHPKVLTKEEYYNRLHKLIPIYSLTEGLTNNSLMKSMAYAIENLKPVKDYVPAHIIKECNVMPFMQAVKKIHFPNSREEAAEARKRFVFDEFFTFLLMLRYYKKGSVRIKTKRVYTHSEECDRLINSLPYKLTGAQKKVWSEVMSDIKSGYIMNRLIQGDVGSGKTIIAALALLLNAKNGYQGALMVPTEVLAKQHYENFVKLFEGFDVNVTLLTGSMSALAKRNEYENIRSHKTDIIIGTHALIQEKVIYDDLGLVIIDEQHRFGVNQRKNISDKGNDCHTIVMSATPIPRTLAIILYGDMDISIINERPEARLPILNCVVGQSYRNTAYSFILKEINKGNRAYIICPMIEESESSELENVNSYYIKLSEIMPDNINIDILHGKMKPSEKNEVMERFKNGLTDILISTTVIEVGIDVPEATVMMVENAERFGLAQLHQLRGRVGRSDRQSYCIFMTADERKEVMQRLEVLNKSNDGFYIADQDLKLRGPGDMFGVRQSGEAYFEIADIYNDADMLKLADSAVKSLSDEDVQRIIEICPKKNRYTETVPFFAL